MRRLVALLVALLFASPALLAQRANSSKSAPRDSGPALERDALVRLSIALPKNHPEARYDRVTGRLLRLDTDSVVIESGGTRIAFPRFGVRSIAVRSGYRSPTRMYWRGAGIGLLSGAVIGGTIGYATYDADCRDVICFTAPQSAALGALLLSVPAMLLGGSIGYARAGEQWRPVSLDAETRVGVVASPTRIGMTVRF